MSISRYRTQMLPATTGASSTRPSNFSLELVESLGDQTLVVVAVYRAPYNLLGGLYDHAGDFLTQFAQRRLPLAVYILAGPFYHPVSLLAGLLLGPLTLSLSLLAGLFTDLACLLASLLDLLTVIFQKLAGLFPSLLRLVYGLLDGLLALPDLIPDRRVDEPHQEREEEMEGCKI